MDDILKCYQILDLAPGVPAEMVRRSYIELTQVWDPARYENNPVLYARAEQKRNEIDEAYRTIRAFLPELQNPEYKPEQEARPQRDFTELATELPGQSRTKTVSSDRYFRRYC